MGSRRAGRGLKRSLEAVGFILAEFELKPSHVDPIRDQNYGFGTYDHCTPLLMMKIQIRISVTSKPDFVFFFLI